MWFLLNVSPDVRQQILAFPELRPPEGAQRGTVIAGCVLTDAELDHTGGLLVLREGGPFAIHCTATVRRGLNRYFPVEPILASFSNPPWIDLPLDTPVDLRPRDESPSGLRIRAFEVDRHVPRFVSDDVAAAAGSVIGLQVEDIQTGGRLVYAPCLASLTPLEGVAAEADCLMIDGTFWEDEEPIRSGIGSRTARAMGHLPVSGPGGSLQWLGKLKAPHRVYVHINNTNPMLNEAGPEHRAATDAGVRVGADGDEFAL
jgi:pyrroloquinoline quinone biosynthesis protein B